MAKASGNGGAASVTPRDQIPGLRRYVKRTRKLEVEICKRMGEGETWLQISKDDHMPSQAMLYRWRAKSPAFAVEVAEAMEMAADRVADEVLITARGVTPATATADRVRISGLQWTAAKAAPHRYGARAEGRDPPVQKIEVRVRRFEKAVGPDGKAFLREILPEGEQ